jgi:hypothetical protein
LSSYPPVIAQGLIFVDFVSCRGPSGSTGFCERQTVGLSFSS